MARVEKVTEDEFRRWLTKADFQPKFAKSLPTNTVCYLRNAACWLTITVCRLTNAVCEGKIVVCEGENGACEGNIGARYSKAGTILLMNNNEHRSLNLLELVSTMSTSGV
jgi:hypothetical protein